jgi:hypothetical protein
MIVVGAHIFTGALVALAVATRRARTASDTARAHEQQRQQPTTERRPTPALEEA